ncbi:MAG: hypothetical protein WD708_06105 [Kiritimatiellia bacterium]
MNVSPHILAVLLLTCVPRLSAQDAETQYLRLQEGYTQRVQDIVQRFETQQSELLNKFILALVRKEQDYRDDGDLDGLMYSRNLREELLEKVQFPGKDPEAPQAVREMLITLFRHRDELITTFQPELDQLNRILLNALEPYQREFTRQGKLELAIEIRTLREHLAIALGEDRS